MQRLLRGALALLVVATACGDGDDVAEEREEREGREVAVYAAVILEVAQDVPVLADGEPSDRVVFVDSLGPDAEIPLEVQVGVVVELEDVVEVVFIDEREEAFNGAEEDGAVREGAALAAVGPVPEGDTRVVVEVMRRLGEGEEEQFRYVVERVGDDWEVAERRSAT